MSKCAQFNPWRADSRWMSGEMDSKAGLRGSYDRLTFDYSTQMAAGLHDVNEKNRSTHQVPSEDLGRPDGGSESILQIFPCSRVFKSRAKGRCDEVEVSLLAEKCSRSESRQRPVFSIDTMGRRANHPRWNQLSKALAAWGWPSSRYSAIQSGNSELPGISVKDGQFRYTFDCYSSG